MKEPRVRSTRSRREFLRLAAAAGVAGALPAAAFAQAPATPAPPAPAKPATPPAAAAPSDAARALTAILQQRLGKDRLSAEQWESVARDFDFDLGAARRMAGVQLANGDEPDFAFFAMPAPAAAKD